MTDIEKLHDLLYRFEYSGLVSKDFKALVSCLSENILGIGMGEQGFVTSLEDVRSVLATGLRSEETFVHQLHFGRTEVRLHTSDFATICAQVVVTSSPFDGSPASESTFAQLLTARRIGEDWKICALHASTPVLTQDMLEAYPLKLAEKTLQILREQMGEMAYQAEEKFREAILADTVAFYIVNFTADVIEKCQCNSDLCAYAPDNTPYDSFITANAPSYVAAEDGTSFLQLFCRSNVLAALEAGDRELSLEYRLCQKDGTPVWGQTVLRVIQDPTNSDWRGILYVRNIDQAKRAQLALLDKATLDGMTKLFNKEALAEGISDFLHKGAPLVGGCLAILDIDDFKDINDSYGHPVGDQALIAVADALRCCFRDSDLIGRLGGDEFCVFLTGTQNLASLEERFSRLMKQVRDIRLPDVPDARLSCSVGIVLRQADDCFDDLYRRADQALYYAKRNGKNRLAFYSRTQQ